MQRLIASFSGVPTWLQLKSESFCQINNDRIKTSKRRVIDFPQSLRISQPPETFGSLRDQSIFTYSLYGLGFSEGQAAISAGRLSHQANGGGTEAGCAHRSMPALLFSPPTPARWERPEVCLSLGEPTAGGQVATSEQHH